MPPPSSKVLVVLGRCPSSRASFKCATSHGAPENTLIIPTKPLENSNSRSQWEDRYKFVTVTEEADPSFRAQLFQQSREAIIWRGKEKRKVRQSHCTTFARLTVRAKKNLRPCSLVFSPSHCCPAHTIDPPPIPGTFLLFLLYRPDEIPDP